MKKLIKKGFTLLELLIVIVILGLLVSLVSVNFLPTLSNAYVEVAKQDISRLQQALVMFKITQIYYSTGTVSTTSKLQKEFYNNNIYCTDM